ncbi:unnamed protein product [Rotaria sordida]|uniref:Uncharacterized protein n=1 Tax=Rotaria sordida TaxID=392033 RepID=A0A813NBW6_9BILA|nr:unnamed protein product [Rotaria sordida]
MGTFSRLKSISTRANDAAENRDNQSTTRSLGEKFGMPGGATSNPLDEAPLTLAESIKRKVSESQKLSPLEMDSDDFSSQEMPATGGDFGRPQSQAQEAQDDSSWSSPTPIGLPLKQKMSAPVTAQGLDWSGAPAGSPASNFEQHPGSAIGLAPPGQKPGGAASSGGGLDWGGGTASTSSANSAQSGWGSTAPAMEATSAPAFAPAAANNEPAAKADGGWGSGWGNENQQAGGATSPPAGVPLKSSDSWAVPGSEAADAWGQPGASPASSPQASTPAPSPAATLPITPSQSGQDPWGSAAVAGSGSSPAAESGGGWSAMNNAAPQTSAEGDGGNWGQAASWGAPNTPLPTSTSNSLPSASAAAAAPVATDPWAQPASATPAAAAPTVPVVSDPWAAATAPAPVSNDPWATAAPAANTEPAPAAPANAPINDPWAAATAAPASNDAWGAAPAAAPASNDAWGAAPAAAPASNDAWGAAPAAAPATPAAAPANNAPINDPWAAAAAAPQAIAAPASDAGWGAAPQPEVKAEAAPAAMGWGQSAAPAQSAEPAAWGNPTTPAAAPPAQSWSPEGEQMETGVWKSFTPKTGPLAPAQAPAAPAAQPGGDRWDQPIQDRPKEAAAAAAPGAAADRWDVPIQARTAGAELPAAAPVTAVGTSGIPVNQIVEKMGVVLGGPAGAAADSRWDLPIQERPKEVQNETPAAAAPAAFSAPAAPAASPAWGETPAPTNTWGTHPEQPTTTPWGAVSAPADAPLPSAAPADGMSNWGNVEVPFSATSAPAEAPAAWAAPAQAAPSPTAWCTVGSTTVPTVGCRCWSLSAPCRRRWGADSTQIPAPAPAPAQNPTQAPAAAADQWGQPPAWGQAQVPQAAAPAAPEVTDKAAPGGMFNLGDQDIDKIFGDNLGVSEPVGRTLVNNGAEPQPVGNGQAQPAAQTNNFAPPPSPPANVPANVQGDATAKNGLFQLTDNDLDKLFSSNLGVDEPSTQVGVQPNITPVQAAPNNFAPPAAASAPAWNTGADQQAAPSGWGVSAPSPAPVAAATGAPSGWSGAGAGAQQAPSGWGMEAAPQPPAGGPSGWSSSPAPAVEAQPSGWGSPTAPTPPAWNQPAAAAPAAEPAKGGLFSVDDNVMNRIFSDNLGIPDDGSKANDAYAIPAQNGEQAAPPKIAGIGRLDASGDQNQDAGSGRIASIGNLLCIQQT